MKALAPFLESWRSSVVGGREIVDAVVRTECANGSEHGLEEFTAALERWPGIHYWTRDGGRDHLVLIRVVASRGRDAIWLHVALFGLTFLTVLMAGAMLAGSPVGFRTLVPSSLGEFLSGLGSWIGLLGPGAQFAIALMGILLAHEMGHYVAARKYEINASLPYFLPAPLWWNFIGTFGAFIRIRSPIVDRRQLMDVGAAGPWAGFVIAVLCLVAGLAQSAVVPTSHGAGQMILVAGTEFPLGDSVVLIGLRSLFSEPGTVILHPLAFAGWLGLFVTTLNMLPLGQLDGGHVMYALVGDSQRVVGWTIWFALIVLGFWFKGWWLWAALTLLLGRGRLAHPSVLDKYRPIPASRVPIGWATILLFVATFAPIPFPI